MSMQMLKTRIKSLGADPLGDTEDALRKQLAFIEQPKKKVDKQVEPVNTTKVDKDGQPAMDDFGEPIEGEIGDNAVENAVIADNAVETIEQEKPDVEKD